MSRQAVDLAPLNLKQFIDFGMNTLFENLQFSKENCY